MIPLRDDNWSQFIKSGDRIFFGSFGGCPHTLIGRFLAQSHRFSDIEIVHLLTLGEAPWTAPEYSDSLRLNSFFLGPNTRDVVNAGDEGGGKAVKHTDCASCHAGAAATLPLPVAGLSSAPRDGVGEQPPPRYRSHTPSGPERPDIV